MAGVGSDSGEHLDIDTDSGADDYPDADPEPFVDIDIDVDVDVEVIVVSKTVGGIRERRVNEAKDLHRSRPKGGVQRDLLADVRTEASGRSHDCCIESAK